MNLKRENRFGISRIFLKRDKKSPIILLWWIFNQDNIFNSWEKLKNIYLWLFSLKNNVRIAILIYSIGIIFPFKNERNKWYFFNHNIPKPIIDEENKIHQT